MQTLKQVKIEMYDNMKDRGNDFLGDEERYIVENLTSDPNLSGSISKYNEAEAFSIACESLEGDTKTDKEELNWEAGYVRGYEVALKEFRNLLGNTYTDSGYRDNLNYLLNN